MTNMPRNKAAHIKGLKKTQNLQPKCIVHHYQSTPLPPSQCCWDYTNAEACCMKWHNMQILPSHNVTGGTNNMPYLLVWWTQFFFSFCKKLTEDALIMWGITLAENDHFDKKKRKWVNSFLRSESASVTQVNTILLCCGAESWGGGWSVIGPSCGRSGADQPQLHFFPLFTVINPPCSGRAGREERYLFWMHHNFGRDGWPGYHHNQLTWPAMERVVSGKLQLSPSTTWPPSLLSTP